MDLNDFVQRATPVLIAAAWKLAGAIALWILGPVLISFALRMVERALNRQQDFDANAHYWQVYVDTNRLIRKAFTEAGFPSPALGYVITGIPAA